MANPFQMFVQRLIDLGFYDFVFPFIITSALLYALLRKTKIFGESVAVNAVVALSIGFMIFGFPVLAGLTLATNWSIFFTQATVFLLIFFVALLLSSLFYPDLMKMLAEQFTRRTTLYQMIALAVALLVTSGLVVVFTNALAPKPGKEGGVGPPADVVLMIAAIIIFIVLVIIASAIARGGG
jgi:hypothetical protein